ASAGLSFITFAYEGISREERFGEILSAIQDRGTVVWDDAATTAMVSVRTPNDNADPPLIIISMLMDEPKEAILHLDLQTTWDVFADVIEAVSGLVLDGVPVFASLPRDEIVALVAAASES